MKPVTESALTIGYHSRTSRSLDANGQFCGATFFVLYERDRRLSITLAMVADGIGDDAFSEEASQLAVQVVRRHFSQSNSSDILRILYQAQREANQLLYERGLAYSEMGGRLGAALATAVIVENKLYISNVGDSCIYLLRPDGHLVQLTIDRRSRSDLRSSPADDHLDRYLGQAPEVIVDFRLGLGDNQTDRDMLSNQGVQLQPGDALLLVTGGVADAVSSARIEAILSRYAPDRAAERLTQAAFGRSGQQAVSALVLKVPSLTPVAQRGLPDGMVRQIGLILAGLMLVVGLVFGASQLVASFDDAGALPTLAPSVAPTEEELLFLPTVIPSDTPPPTASPTETAAPTNTPTSTVTATATRWPTQPPRPLPVVTAIPSLPTIVPTTQEPSPEPTRLPPTEPPVEVTQTSVPTEMPPEATPSPVPPLTPSLSPTHPSPEPTRTPIPRQ